MGQLFLKVYFVIFHFVSILVPLPLVPELPIFPFYIENVPGTTNICVGTESRRLPQPLHAIIVSSFAFVAQPLPQMCPSVKGQCRPHMQNLPAPGPVSREMR